MAQEFHISVTPLRGEDYLVRTEQVAQGVPLAEEQVAWSVQIWLEQTNRLLNDPLLTLLQQDTQNNAGAIAANGELSLSLVRLGQELHRSLFQGHLRDSWVTAQGIAYNRGELLRLRLGLRGLRLPRLPWEVLCEGALPERSRPDDLMLPALRPVAAGMNVLFSRYLTGTRLLHTGTPNCIEPGQPLRILMAIASPTDRDRLNLRREAEALQRELGTHDDNAAASGALPEIQLTILEQPGREQLTQALEQGQYQVFHFAGHSTLGAAGGNLYLVNPATGLTEMLSGNDLAGLLVNNHICMAMFNSCQGSFTAAPDPSAEMEGWNLAEALFSRGVPAVLAMAEQIPDHVALTLTRLFYRNLKQGYPIDLSLNRARQGLISAYGSQQLYWALPVLYMHPEFDGYLVAQETTGAAGDRPLPADLGMVGTVYSPGLESITEAILGNDDELVAEVAALEVPLPMDVPLEELDDLPDSLVDERDVDLDEDLEDLTETSQDEAIANMVQRLSGEPVETRDAEIVEPDEQLPGLLPLDATDTTPPLPAPLFPDMAGDRPDAEQLLTPTELVSLDTLFPPARRTSPEPPPRRGSSVDPHILLPIAGAGVVAIALIWGVSTLWQTEGQPPQEAQEPLDSSSPSVAVSPLDSPTPTIITSPDAFPLESPSPLEPGGLRPIPSDVLPDRPMPERSVQPLEPERFPSRPVTRPVILPPSRPPSRPASVSEPTLIADRPSRPDSRLTEADLLQAEPEELKEIAIDRYEKAAQFLQQNNFAAAEEAIALSNSATKILLDYNELSLAETALRTAVMENITDAMTTFLRGRLAWQVARSSNPVYQVEDARELWEQALAQNPSSRQYRNALGFAYYLEGQNDLAQGQSDAAWERWSLALTALEAFDSDCYSNPTSCAIRALIYQRLATYAPDRQQEYLQAAIALRDQVLAADAASFKRDTLAQNWLWTSAAIDEWQRLVDGVN